MGAAICVGSADRHWLALACAGFAAAWLACPGLALAAAAASPASEILFVAPVDADVAQRAAVLLVLDEVEKRTRVRWSVRFGADDPGHGARTRIIAARLDQIAALLPAAPSDRDQQSRAPYPTDTTAVLAQSRAPPAHVPVPDGPGRTPPLTDIRTQLDTCAALARPEGYAIGSLAGPGGG